MSPHPAIRLLTTTTTKSSSKLSKPSKTLTTLHLSCHVKPSANAQRQGLLSISPSKIELCVSAPPREGEANKAVLELLSTIFKCPKSDVEVIRGLKSRNKTIAIHGIHIKVPDDDDDDDEEACISTILAKLQEAVVEK